MSELYRTRLDEYAEKYASFLRFRRENGILEARFHTDDQALVWNPEAHRAVRAALFDINMDPENECLIITGTGDTFLGPFSHHPGWRDAGFSHPDWVQEGPPPQFGEQQAYDIQFKTQSRLISGLLDLQIPVIAALNGPVVAHAELVLLNDIVICADHASIKDGHWGSGVVPGDGCEILFRHLLGPNRARYFLWMGQEIGAAEALQLGLVGEVHSADVLLDRAWQIAETVFMSKSRIHRRMARQMFTQPWREVWARTIDSQVAHQALAAVVRSMQV
jgi:enoyl-CoA hydratase/carnithine racemase